MWNKPKLDTYTWPGCYAVNYLVADGGYICADCANGENSSDASAFNDDPQWQIIAQDIYWEGPDRTCDHCEITIESEYGDPHETPKGLK